MRVDESAILRLACRSLSVPKNLSGRNECLGKEACVYVARSSGDPRNICHLLHRRFLPTTAFSPVGVARSVGGGSTRRILRRLRDAPGEDQSQTADWRGGRIAPG